MGNNLECVVHRGAAELGIGEIPEDNDFRFADWCAARFALLLLLPADLDALQDAA